MLRLSIPHESRSICRPDFALHYCSVRLILYTPILWVHNCPVCLRLSSLYLCHGEGGGGETISIHHTFTWSGTD